MGFRPSLRWGGLVGGAILGLLLPAPTHAQPFDLSVAAFRDITAFILQGGASPLIASPTYVADADQAHSFLKNATADVVFMSYDDTLSIYFDEAYTNVRAVLPVHGGILNFTGELNLETGKNVVGIDTESGYARALIYYLHEQYGDDFSEIELAQVGATNLRYQLLVDGNIDATLLNPPFSLMPDVPNIVRMLDVIGPYQGIVANVRADWLADLDNAITLQDFADAFYNRVNALKNNREQTIGELMDFYGGSLPITEEVAGLIYDRLWEPDGLALGEAFDPTQLTGTEFYYTYSTGTLISGDREWVAAVPEPSSLALLGLGALAVYVVRRKGGLGSWRSKAR